MEKSPFHCAEQAYIPFFYQVLLILKAFAELFCCLQLQQVFKARTLLRSSFASISLASDSVWVYYADFSIVLLLLFFFLLCCPGFLFFSLTQSNVTFCCFQNLQSGPVSFCFLHILIAFYKFKLRSDLFQFFETLIPFTIWLWMSNSTNSLKQHVCLSIIKSIKSPCS